MSRSFHHGGHVLGKLPKDWYKCICTRRVRNKNRHLLRILIQKYSGEDLDYNVRNVSKNEVYNPMDWD